MGFIAPSIKPKQLSNALPLNLSHGHSFQEVEGSAVYCSTESFCDCALDRMYQSRGWKSYSAPEPADQIVELNRCICMGKQIVSILYKALLPHHEWFHGDNWKTEGAARPLKGGEAHSYKIETQPNTRCCPSHLSRTLHNNRKGNLGFFRDVFIVKKKKFVLGNIIVISTFEEKFKYISKGCHIFTYKSKACYGTDCVFHECY